MQNARPAVRDESFPVTARDAAVTAPEPEFELAGAGVDWVPERVVVIP